jgi:hypothetical protein
VKVVIHSAERYQSSVSNPLGLGDNAPHRIWTWADGSWLLVRFLDDGCARAVTSQDLRATLVDHGPRLHVRVERREATMPEREARQDPGGNLI